MLVVFRVAEKVSCGTIVFTGEDPCRNTGCPKRTAALKIFLDSSATRNKHHPFFARVSFAVVIIAACIMYRKFKPRFFWPEQYRWTVALSIAFLLMKILVLLQPARAAQRSEAREVFRLSRRSLEFRASGAVGLRWQADFDSSRRLEQIESLRRRSATVRRSAGQWVRILTITGGSSMAAMILKLVGDLCAVVSIVEIPFGRSS